MRTVGFILVLSDIIVNSIVVFYFVGVIFFVVAHVIISVRVGVIERNFTDDTRIYREISHRVLGDVRRFRHGAFFTGKVLWVSLTVHFGAFMCLRLYRQPIMVRDR